MNHPKIWSKHLRSGSQQAAPQVPQRPDRVMNLQATMECSSNKKQLDKLSKKPKTKQTKLLSSKSLSQLVSRGLFFKRSTTNDQQTKNELENGVYGRSHLATTKSFPISTYRAEASGRESSSSIASSGGHEQEFIGRVISASMIGFPRQSSSSTFAVRSNNSTMEQPNLSPIVIGSQHEVNRHEENGINDEVIDMSWTETRSPTTSGEQIDQKEVQQNNEIETNKKVSNKGKGSRSPKRMASNDEASGGVAGKLRSFKNTTLVLRDVKNSIGLRMKAKHESQAFAKLTNEQSTPPTKLYSPFNIYTPDSCTKDSNGYDNETSERQGKKMDRETASGYDCRTPNNNKGNKQQETATVKSRIAFRHKKHLMQANKFTFDSPTGRLRETVKDVEHFQQCIEDISKAIKARDSL